MDLILNYLNHLERQTLIILDDFGLQNLGQEVRLTLLQLLEDRYGKKSIIVTSQLPVAKWYEYINEPTLADAILDRLTANAHRIELKGESLRRKKIKDISITLCIFNHHLALTIITCFAGGSTSRNGGST